MPFQGDRRVLQQMIQVLLISEKYGCKVIQATSWASYTLIWSLITCLLLATIPTETSNSITTVASFVHRLQTKKQQRKTKNGANLILQSLLKVNSCLIVDICSMLHQLPVMYAVYLMVIRWQITVQSLYAIHEMWSQIHYAVSSCVA